jgi:hypothetical protein
MAASTTSLNVPVTASTGDFQKGMADAQKYLSNFVAQAKAVGPATSGVSTAFKGLDVSSRAAQANIKNVSFQISDLAVQMASGTSATRALAQQLPQLLGGFGTVGAVVGTLAAVLIPLASNILGVGQQTKTLSDAAKEIKTNFGEWQTASRALQAELELLRTKSIETGTAVKQSLIGDLRLSRDQLLTSFKGLTTTLGNDFKQFQGYIQNTDNVLKRLSPSVLASLSGFQRMGREIKVLTPQARSLVDTLAGLENLGASSRELDTIAQKLEKVNKAAEAENPLEYARAMTDLKNETVALLEKLGVAPGVIQAIVKPMNDAAASAYGLAKGFDAAKISLSNFLAEFAKYQSLGQQMSSSYGFSFTPTIKGIEGTEAAMKRLRPEFQGMQNDLKIMQNTAQVNAEINARKILQNYIPAADQIKTKLQEIETARRTLGLNATSEDLRNMDNATKELNKQLADLATGGSKGGSGGGGGKLGAAAKGVKALGDAAKKGAQDLKQVANASKDWAEGIQNILESGLNGVVDAMFAIAEGSKSAKEAFSDLAKSMLRQIAQLIIQLTIIKPLMAAIGLPMAGGGGLLGGVGMASRSLMPANRMSIGSSLGNAAIGNYTGFNLTPAISQFKSASLGNGLTASTQPAPMNVVINNYAGAQIKTRQNNGQVEIDVIMDVMADALVRGGNKVDAALQRAYGAKRVGY